MSVFGSLIAIFFLFHTFCLGQIEYYKKSIPDLSERTENKLPKLNLMPKTKNKLPFNYKIENKKDKEDDIGFVSKNNMADAKELHKTKFYENGKQPVSSFMRNQNFGNVKTSSDYANILCRDHESVDGDIIAIYLNDQIIVPKMVLQGSFVGYRIPLKKGFNKIDFVALNEGYYAPNTAEFEVFDDSNTLIANQRWSLSSGFRASVLVINK